MPCNVAVTARRPIGAVDINRQSAVYPQISEVSEKSCSAEDAGITQIVGRRCSSKQCVISDAADWHRYRCAPVRPDAYLPESRGRRRSLKPSYRYAG